MKKITIWSRIDRDGQTHHNHIENSWVSNNKPIGDKSQTKAWKSSEWEKKFGYLDSNNVVREAMDVFEIIKMHNQQGVDVFLQYIISNIERVGPVEFDVVLDVIELIPDWIKNNEKYCKPLLKQTEQLEENVCDFSVRSALRLEMFKILCEDLY